MEDVLLNDVGQYRDCDQELENGMYVGSYILFTDMQLSSCRVISDCSNDNRMVWSTEQEDGVDRNGGSSSSTDTHSMAPSMEVQFDITTASGTYLSTDSKVCTSSTTSANVCFE